MEYSRTNQGGSILAFVVVGVVFAAMVVGGVYLLRQRGEQARTGQPEVAKTDTSKQSAPQQTSQPSDQSTDKNKQQPSDNNSTDKKSENKPSPSPSQSQSQSQGNNQMPATGQEATPPATDQQAGTKPNVASGAPVDHSDKLPVTGPLDTLFQLIAIGGLTAIVVAYIRSQVQVKPSL